MTDAEKRTFLTEVTGEENASVLDRALADAKDAILEKAFPFLSNRPSVLPAAYEGKQLAIAKFLILKQGAEGEKEHTENSIKRVYDGGDIPPSMLSGIVGRMKTLRTEATDESAET